MLEIRAEIGDITRLAVDAIVNAANSTLVAGGGVDGAVHRVAGPKLQEACRRLRGCQPGEAKLTPGFDLPARHVIHTVGPIWRGGAHGEAGVLASCYRSALGLARLHGLRSLAFPCISTGAYGFPAEHAAEIAVSTVRAANPGQLELVIFCCFHDRDGQIYQRLLAAPVR